MTLINQDIKNLVSGISQQPPILRHPEQLEEQVNGFSTEAGGLQKRPPTLFVSTLQEYDRPIKPFIHFINRDEIEQYCLIFDGTDVFVYDLEGTPITVNYTQDKSYIQTNSPRLDLKMVTIADYTFIVNRNKTVAMSSALSTDYWETQGILVNIKSGQYGRKYKVVINGEAVAQYETPDGSKSEHTKQIATDYIASQLANQINNGVPGEEVDEGIWNEPIYSDGVPPNPHWQATVGSSWLYITTKDNTSVTSFDVYDGYNNQAAYGCYKTTQKFSNLPSTAPNGFVVKVLGEEGSSTDDYYVKYDVSQKAWVETIKPGIPYEFDLSTMPHVLVREADGTFTFKRGDWSPREIGDEESNPLPSFVDFKLNDIFYHRNRLGVLAGENAILTRSADFFNFWMQSATKVQDTDPIDLAASDNTICTLYNAVPYDKELILFSKEAQFALHSDGLMAPKDAVITPPITHYEASLKAAPINAGRNIYFVAERARHTTVREFFTAADNTEAKDVQDITSHCPNYIPNGVYKIIPSTVENIMLYLTEGNENSMYVYKYLFIDGQRVQAAWSQWDFGNKVFGGAFIDNLLYVVIERQGKICLEKMSFTFNTTDLIYEPYRVLLDSKRSYIIPDECYDSLKDETKVKVSDIRQSTYEPHMPYSAVATDGTYVNEVDGYFVFLGDYSGDTITVGINYNFKVVMSTIMVKQSEQGNTKAMTDGRLQLKQMWFNFADTGYFKVTCTTKDKGAYCYEYTSRVLGTLNNILGDIPFTTGNFRFPIQCKNENVIITLETDNPLPVSIVGAGWIGNYVRRSRLY